MSDKCPWEDAPVLCKLKKAAVPKVCRVPMDAATEKLKTCFDYKFDGTTEVYPFVIPTELFNVDVNIIQIVGPSGSGKSTFLKAFEKAGWHNPTRVYDNSKAIVSNFGSDPDEGVNRFNAVGLSSIKDLCKPRNVLSTGQGFRADLALNIESNVMIDEYTSVVNREVAMAASKGLQRYIRERGFKNVILCGCHYDIIPYVKPDILIDLNKEKVYDLRNKELRDTLLKKASTSPSSKSLGATRSERSGTYLLHITI